jgi:hypothetical protein
METLPLKEGELGELIRFSMTSGEPIAGAVGKPALIIAQTGEKTLRKLAEMRGIKLEK